MTKRTKLTTTTKEKGKRVLPETAGSMRREPKTPWLKSFSNKRPRCCPVTHQLLRSLLSSRLLTQEPDLRMEGGGRNELDEGRRVTRRILGQKEEEGTGAAEGGGGFSPFQIRRRVG
ncbi:hypothetical protein LINPERPRIM_LOCUS4945 [Linum perenne]